MTWFFSYLDALAWRTNVLWMIARTIPSGYLLARFVLVDFGLLMRGDNAEPIRRILGVLKGL
jgi:hypothetical protein